MFGIIALLWDEAFDWTWADKILLYTSELIRWQVSLHLWYANMPKL